MPFDHFNLVAGIFDRLPPYVIDQPLKELLSLSADHLLLDAGGGTGRVAMALRDKVRQAVVADVAYGMLRRAAGRGLESVSAPAERLPFPSGTFDRIIMLDALHHVQDQSRTARELWRVLSSNGRLVIVEPDIQQFPVKMIALMEKLLLMRSHFLPGAEIAALFDGPGARVKTVYHQHNVMVAVEKVREL